MTNKKNAVVFKCGMEFSERSILSALIEINKQVSTKDGIVILMFGQGFKIKKVLGAGEFELSIEFRKN